MPGQGGGKGVLGRMLGRFGEVAKRLGFVRARDVRRALDHQEERNAEGGPHRKIGEVLVDQGKMKDQHVEKVLAEQKKSARKPKTAAKPGKKTTKKTTKKAAKKKARKKAKKAGRG